MPKFLISIFLMLPSLVFGQFTKKQERLAYKQNQCYHSNKYNAAQRQSFFPFDKAVTIKLISFSLPSDVNNSEDTVSNVYTPIAPGRYYLNYKRVKESKTLSVMAIDFLTDILYNVGYTPVKSGFRIPDTGRNCYDPHNAILFVDAKGIVTQYIELCFECKRYYLSSPKIKNTEYCEQKYDMLRAFFVSQGIKYGTALPKRED